MTESDHAIDAIANDPRLHRNIDRAAVLMDAETDLIDCEATERNTEATEEASNGES